MYFHFLSLSPKSYYMRRRIVSKLLLIPFLFLCFFTQAQTRVLKGKVISAQGPVSGASVLVKGKTAGTATANDGTFTLSVPAGRNTLVVTSIGYIKTEQPVEENEANVTITLTQDNGGLSEVVVTALGINRQSKTLPYATQGVKVGSLTEVRDPNNVLNSLQGKVANAVITQGSGGPGSGARIVLRGNRSIQQSNNALSVNASAFSKEGSVCHICKGRPQAIPPIRPDHRSLQTALRA